MVTVGYMKREKPEEGDKYNWDEFELWAEYEGVGEQKED
jgi:hypothetical protein